MDQKTVDRPNFDIAEVVVLRRKALGVTQREVAEMAGCDPAFVGDLENGKPSVRLDKLRAVLDVLGLELTVRVRTPQ